MDLDAVERLELNAVGDADAITVNDLTGTDLKATEVDLSASGGGGDAQADKAGVVSQRRAIRSDQSQTGPDAHGCSR